MDSRWLAGDKSEVKKTSGNVDAGRSGFLYTGQGFLLVRFPLDRRTKRCSVIGVVIFLGFVSSLTGSAGRLMTWSLHGIGHLVAAEIESVRRQNDFSATCGFRIAAEANNR